MTGDSGVMPPPMEMREPMAREIKTRAEESSRPVVRRAAPHLRFAELKLKELAYTRRVGVIYRKDAYLSPAARRFIEILKQTAKEIGAGNR